MKRLLLSGLFCALYVVAAAEVFNGTCGENLKYTFDSGSGVLTITGSGPMKDWKTYDATPWYIAPYKVKQVNLPEGLTSIGNYAFSGQPIKNIKLPATIKIIGKHAFEKCYDLSIINIPQGCKYVDDNAFYNCKMLQSLNIPDNVEYIGERAFYSCESLKTFNLPRNLKRLGKEAFFVYNGGIRDMEEIYIPEKLTALKNGVFHGRRFKTIHIPSSINVIEDDAFYAERVCITDIEAWCDIQFEMGHYPPLENGYLVVNGAIIKELEIPEGVTRISNYAFYRYSKLSSVTIPRTVEYIGDNAFYECSGLTDVYNHAEKVIPIRKGTFYSFRPQAVIDFYVDADKVDAYKQMQEKWYQYDEYAQRKLKIHTFHTSEELSNPYIDEVIDYQDADEKPQYVGGGQAYLQYWKTNLRCPLSAYEIGAYYSGETVLNAKVYCEFIINIDGSISDVKTVRYDIKRGFEMGVVEFDAVKDKFCKEAERFTKSMPRWTPGKYRDYPVRVRCQMPIEFKYNINFK